MNPLKSLMALSLALVMAAQPAAISAGDETAPEEPGARAVAALSGAVNDIGTALNGAAAQTDVAARFKRYFETAKESGGKLYIDAGAAEANVTGAGAAITAWVQNQENRGKAAVLYFVMGEDAAPLAAWSSRFPNLALADRKEEAHRELDGALATRMLLFSVDQQAAQELNPAQAGVDCSKAVGAFKDQAVERWVGAFLHCGATYAEAIVNALKIEKRDVLGSVIFNEERPAVPVGPDAGDPRRRPAVPMGSAFNTDGLYLHGGVWRQISDATPGVTRQVSVKIYMERVGDRLVQRLGFFDVRRSAAQPQPSIAWQVLDFTPGEKTIGDMKVTVKADGTITVAGSGAGGESFSTTRAQLEQVLAEHAAQNGAEDRVEGRNYKIIGQGGAPAGYLYYPMNEDGSLASAVPSHRGDVVTMVKDERTGQWYPKRLEGDQNLGWFTNPENRERSHYLLSWNDRQRYWEPKKGDPVAAPPPAPEQPATDQPGTDQPRTDQPRTDQPAGPRTDQRTDVVATRPDAANVPAPNACTIADPAIGFGFGQAKPWNQGGKDWMYTRNAESVYMCFYGNAFYADGHYLTAFRETETDIKVTMARVETFMAALGDVVPRDRIADDGNTSFQRGGATERVRLTALATNHLLKSRLIAARGERTASGPDKLSWLIEQHNYRDNSQNQFQLFTDADGAQRVTNALALLDRSDRSSLFGGTAADVQANRTKLQTFLNACITADTGAAATGVRSNALIYLHKPTGNSTTRIAIYHFKDGRNPQELMWRVPEGPGEPALESRTNCN